MPKYKNIGCQHLQNKSWPDSHNPQTPYSIKSTDKFGNDIQGRVFVCADCWEKCEDGKIEEVLEYTFNYESEA